MRIASDIGEGLRIAFRALRANKMRAILTTLGIVIGVTTVVLMISIILGLNKSFENQFSFLGTNTLYVSRWDWNGENWREMMKRREMKAEYAEMIRRESKLAIAVTPWASVESSVNVRENRLAQVMTMGVNQDYPATNPVRIDLGRFINEDDVSHNRQVAVIGTAIRENLFDKVDPIGQEITINGYKYMVIGVQEKMGKFFGQDMDNYVQIPVTTLMKRFGKDRDLDIIAKAATPAQVEDLMWELRGIMRHIRRLSPIEPDDFGVNNQSMFLVMYKQVTGGVYLGGILIAFISLLVGGIGIMNIMLVSVTERTSEVGLRKALGAKRWMILWQFLVESAVICSLGGLLGVLLAMVGAQQINKFFTASMPLWLFGFGIIFSAIVGIFFGLYPAMKAAKLSPIEALRQE